MDAVVQEKKKVGRPPSRKKLLTLRLEPEIVDYFREQGGKGWLAEVNNTLKRAMQKRQARAAQRRGKLAGEGQEVSQDALHNRLMEEFVRKVVGEVYSTGGSFEDVMVMLESITMAIMLLAVAKEKMEPHVAVGLVEAMEQRAIERFAGSVARG